MSTTYKEDDMIRGRKRQLEKAPEVKAKLNCSTHNRFDIEVIDAATGEIKRRAQAENVICAALWTRLLTPASYFNYIHYGTGSGTPASTDASLFAFLGYGTPSYTDDVIDIQAASGYVSYRRKIQLSESTAIGSTLTEVGIGYSTTAATLVTHAMLKDMNGNAISIAKTATDIINIYATVFVHWTAAGDDSGCIKVFPSLAKTGKGTYPLDGFIGMLLGVYYSGGYAKPPAFMSPRQGCGTTSGSTTALATTYSVSNKTITLTATRLAASSFNIGGFIGAILFTSTDYPSFYIKVGGSWYPYSSIVGEAIGTGDGETTDFATDFPFPYDATVYVDGVAQPSGVTVAAEPLLISDMGQYFDSLDAASTISLHIPAANPALSTIKYGSFVSGNSYIYYNPNYSFGIASLYRGLCTVSVSNDLSTWTQIAAAGTGTVSVDGEYRNYKYWKFTGTGSGYVQAMTAPSTYTGKPIHFTTAPANGAVITADYKTPVVAKDINHVFDLSVVITLAEHTA